MTDVGRCARPRTRAARRLLGAAAVGFAVSSAAVASPAVAVPSAPGQATPELEVDVIDITGPGGQGFVPVEINIRGQVSGFVPSTGYSFGTPLLWDDGEVHELAPGTNGLPQALNAWGEVVGSLADPSGATSAFRWRAGRLETVPDAEGVDVNELAQALRLDRTGEDGDDVDLVVDGLLLDTSVSLPDGPTVSPVAIANDGRVTGNLIDEEAFRTTAFTWSRRDGTTLIEADGMRAIVASASNDAGDVIGRATTVEGDERAFIWRDGELTDLGSLDGGYTTVVKGIFTPADLAINASNRQTLNVRGQVIGTSYRQRDGVRRGFIWDDGQMTDLGDLRDGCVRVTPTAINTWGQVVGSCETAEPLPLAFLWEGGAMHELGSLFDVGVPVGINDRGQILTLAASPDGMLMGHVVTVRR